VLVPAAVARASPRPGAMTRRAPAPCGAMYRPRGGWRGAPRRGQNHGRRECGASAVPLIQTEWGRALTDRTSQKTRLRRCVATGAPARRGPRPWRPALPRLRAWHPLGARVRARVATAPLTATRSSRSAPAYSPQSGALRTRRPREHPPAHTRERGQPGEGAVSGRGGKRRGRRREFGC
jgi:hypothetical protein